MIQQRIKNQAGCTGICQTQESKQENIKHNKLSRANYNRIAHQLPNSITLLGSTGEHMHSL